MEKPTIKQRLDGFAKFIWNGEEKTFLGRGGRSWAEIGIFYLIYYSCLAGFFCATIAVFYQTIDSDHPKLQGSDSLLKGNPGMGFKPMPDIETTLIMSTADKAKFKKHIASMTKNTNKVLMEYKDALEDVEDCTDKGSLRTKDQKACKVDFNELTKECNEANNFGMDNNKPCVLLKLNRIYGWEPKLWEPGHKKIPKEIAGKYTNDKIWVYCHGENDADEDNIGLNEIAYYPQQGFPLAYYPYYKQKNYRSPLIFVQFKNITKNLGLMVECKAYAENIEVDLTDKEGSVHFELLLEDKD